MGGAICAFEILGHKDELTKQGQLARVETAGNQNQKLRASKWARWLRSKRKRALTKPPAAAVSSQHFRHELDEFKRAATLVVRSCGDEHARNIFCQTEVVRHRRLRPMGVQGHQAAITADVCMTPATAQMITEAIVRQKAKTNLKEVKAVCRVINGEATQWILRIAGFASKGPPKWRKASSWPPNRRNDATTMDPSFVAPVCTHRGSSRVQLAL